MSRLGRRLHLSGVPLVIHASWFLAAGLIVLAAAGNPRSVGSSSPVYAVFFAGSFVLLLLLAVLLHELAHVFVARRCRLPIQRIMVYVFGGVPDLDTGVLTPRRDALVAGTGVLASVALTLLCGAGWLVGQRLGTGVGRALQLATAANAFVTLLSVLPGYPLDGGRLVRALVWYVTDDLFTATRIASLYGEVLAWCCLGAGLVLFGWENQLLWGLALLVSGWSLRVEARRGYRALLWQALSRQLPVSQAAFMRPPAIPATRLLSEAVDDVLEGLGQRGEGGPSFVVDERGAVVGVLGLDQLRAAPRARWPVTSVGEAMAPRHHLVVMPQGTRLDAALALLEEADADYGLIVPASAPDSARPVGIVTHRLITRTLYSRLRAGRKALASSDRQAESEKQSQSNRQ